VDMGGPKPLDTNALVNQQLRANTWNQYSPFGSVEYTLDQGGDRNDNAVRMTLSPAERQILEQQQAGRLLAGQTAEGRFADLGSSRQAVEEAQFNRMLALMNPEFDRRERALQQRLANAGLPSSSGAYGREYGTFEDARNRSLEQAAYAATAAGGAEETRIAQLIMQLLGAGSPMQPGSLPLPPPVTIPIQQEQSSPGPLPGLLGLAGLGAGAGLGFATGNPLLGLQGSQAGFGIGSQLPYLFG